MKPFKKLSEEEKLIRIKNYYEKRVIKKEGCWDWKIKERKWHKYIKMSYASKQPEIVAHRFSYLIHKGEIPVGMLVCHTCDNPRCTNPEHLFLGTHSDNIRDKMNKRRQAMGEKNSLSKLKEKDVILIKKLIEIGLTNVQIGRALEIKASNIHYIRTGKTWRHIEC